MSSPPVQSVTPRIQMRGIRKRFGATRALDGVDLCVNPGEVLALVGENGAGKSTLMKVLSGALSADEGSMCLDGEPYHPAGPLAARRLGVGMIYQELSLAPHLSVAANISLGVEPVRCGLLRGGQMRRTAADALRLLDHADIKPSARVDSLSVGQQQIVEIARSLAAGCRVLIFDEPTSSLSREDVRRLFALIARLRSEGIGIIYISHFLEEIREIADRYVVLRDGRSVGQGPMDQADDAAIIGLMVGRNLAELYPRSRRQPAEVVLELDKLSGRSKPVDASLQLRRGEILGIAGLVGAGRTELLRAVFGLDPVRSGRIRVGAWHGAHSPRGRWRQGVGLLSEDRKGEGLALSLSIADNLVLSDLSRMGPLGLVLPWRRGSLARRMIDRLGVRCRAGSQPVGDLSGGNQQKVALARLLAHDVDVMLLDEPTRGIDVGSKAVIYQLLDELAIGRADGRPRAILIVSSYLPELMGVCDRIAVMSRGRIGPARPVDLVDERGLMAEAIGVAS